MDTLVILAALLLIISVTIHSAAIEYTTQTHANNGTNAMWEQFKSHHGKKYNSSEEDKSRKRCFMNKTALVNSHNAEADRGLHTFRVAVNHFSDLNQSEYRSMLGYRRRSNKVRRDIETGDSPSILKRIRRDWFNWHPFHPFPVPQILAPTIATTTSKPSTVAATTLKTTPLFVPTSTTRTAPSTPSTSSTSSPSSSLSTTTVDWRLQGLVTPVKDQTSYCGSCWAFAVTGALEALTKKQTGVLTSLSEENLLDCVTENYGCQGGDTDTAFDYTLLNGGIDTESSYPYRGRAGRCKYSSSHNGVKISNYIDIPYGNEKDLQNAVDTVGPVAIAIDASSDLFQSYANGIYSPRGCSSSQLDHAVLVVGYGTFLTTPYWLVKNSWGTEWGIGGYFLLARNQNNMCGVASAASYPVA